MVRYQFCLVTQQMGSPFHCLPGNIGSEKSVLEYQSNHRHHQPITNQFATPHRIAAFTLEPTLVHPAYTQLLL